MASQLLGDDESFACPGVTGGVTHDLRRERRAGRRLQGGVTLSTVNSMSCG
jgi:hypothetical protein